MAILTEGACEPVAAEERGPDPARVEVGAVGGEARRLEHSRDPGAIEGARLNGRNVQLRRDLGSLGANPREELPTDGAEGAATSTLDEVDDRPVIARVPHREVDPVPVVLAARDDHLVIGGRVPHHDAVAAGFPAIEAVRRAAA